MKKTAFLAMLIVGVALSAEPVKNSSFMFRPLATISASLSGSSDFVFDGQTAFSKTFTLDAIGEIGLINGIYLVGLNIGPQFNVLGSYLSGLYFGAYPGAVYLTNYSKSVIVYDAQFECGYQNVAAGGFSWGVYVGYLLFSNTALTSGFKYGIKIGWAFPDTFIKITE